MIPPLKRVGKFLVLALFVGLMSVNIALQFRVRALASRLEYFERNKGPMVGSAIAPLSGTDFSGRPTTINLGRVSQETLVLVFSPDCGYCKLNNDNWKKIIAGTAPAHILMVDISGTATTQSLESLGLPVNTPNIRISPDSRASNSLTMTPTTLLVSSNGVIEYVTLGVLAPEDITRLAAALAQGTPEGGQHASS